jgi:hypothetical protein
MFYKIKLKYLYYTKKKKKKKKLNPRAVDTIDDIYLLMFMEILIDIFQQEELL